MTWRADFDEGRPVRTEYDERRIVMFQQNDKELVIMAARSLAARAGFNETNQVLIATAASELATNIVKYAKEGEVILRTFELGGRSCMEVLATDSGPGIKDIEKAMQDNFSTTKGSLGLGLPSVKRIMDEFSIESHPGRGTVVRAVKWR